MTEEELRAEAKKLGYNILKKPKYQCSCHCVYPNENCRQKNGCWKCVDKYRPIKIYIKHKWGSGPITYCVRIDKGGDKST